MTVEDELTNFRNVWKKELSSSSLEQQKAKDLYLKGVLLERQGYCYEAVEFFRQSLRLVPDIEKYIDLNRDLDSSSHVTDGSIPYGFEEVEGQSLSNLNSNMDQEQWNERFVTTQMSIPDAEKCVPERRKTGTHISALPNEVILLILRFVISQELDLRSIESFAGTCRWYYNLARSPQIWQAACQKVWPDLKVKPNISGWLGWRGMYINRPHLRFDGVYVSRIKYYREGEQSANLCCTLQTVVYHRFLRFFSDGLVLCLNTTQSPQSAVAALKYRGSSNKDVTYGSYTITGDNISFSLFQRDPTSPSSSTIKLLPALSCNISLSLSKIGGGRQVLEWEKYSITQQRGERTSTCDITLEPPHYCRFVFVRARSYAEVSAGEV